MELGKSDKLKQQALEQETENFRKVKAEIEEGRIEENTSKASALKTFGEPVIVIHEADREKWVYKQAKSDWFGGEKIYLFFDKQGNLAGWEHLNPE